MRKTKIVCTIGPASSSEEVFAEMCRAGLNVARLNFSHGTHAEHQQKFDMIRKVRRELELPIAIMLDTKGPEYRIRTFKNKKITLKDGRSPSRRVRSTATRRSFPSAMQDWQTIFPWAIRCWSTTDWSFLR